MPASLRTQLFSAPCLAPRPARRKRPGSSRRWSNSLSSDYLGDAGGRVTCQLTGSPQKGLNRPGVASQRPPPVRRRDPLGAMQPVANRHCGRTRTGRIALRYDPCLLRPRPAPPSRHPRDHLKPLKGPTFRCIIMVQTRHRGLLPVRPDHHPPGYQSQGGVGAMLTYILLAMVEKPAQAWTPDGGTGEKPASDESMQRLECEVLLSVRQRVEVFRRG
jgi:hypothetical protein